MNAALGVYEMSGKTEIRVDKIEISRLRYESYPDRYRADVCLHIFNGDGSPNGHIHLNCRAHDVDQSDRKALVSQLVGDARRQMAWMPQSGDAGKPVEFPNDMAISVDQ